MKIKYLQTLAIYIYGWNPLVEPFPKFNTPSQSRSETLRIARRSSRWFQIRQQLWRAITFNPCVVGKSEGTSTFVSWRALSWCLRFVDSNDGSSPISVFLFDPGEIFSPVSLHHHCTSKRRFLCFFSFSHPCSPLSLPSLPAGGDPPPASPPPRTPITPPRRWRWPARLPAPLARACPRLCLASPLPFPSPSLFHGWEE
jgi:hypothetical protein